ncbi:Myblike DNA-binding domain containing [Micractinium conductrix]|uniref:Myblike DNA-binding domain containing n=1 Tax=Micractinium conductrix TaxID=554055 RepID=A0A2P6V4V1_9CHLO|nr:Myblike DNA-binding domain containing [Micractinium conductrix]|eukprot:PSC69112.1 Myblike DNA-binding domain containing [Micractinium conductrix]
MAEDGSSFLWAFDRLLDAEGLTIEDLTKTLLPALRLAEPELHESTRARLCLRQLEAGLAVGGVDEDSLSSLHKLLTFDVRGLADPALVAPPPPLLLRVKTELALQAMRPGSGLPPTEAQHFINALFANPTDEEYERFQRLSAALRSPAAVANLDTEFPYHSLLLQLYKFVTKAKVALPALLKTVEADLLSGRYQPGVGGVAGAPAAAAPAVAPPSPPRRTPAGLPSPQRAAVPSPARQPRGASLQGLAAAAAEEAEEDGHMMVEDEGGFESPLRQQQQQQRRAGKAPAAHAVVQQLHESLDDMAQKGGKDPLNEALAAATLAAVGVDRRDRKGRTVAWQESPAAVEHPIPELHAHQYARHSPLVRPASGRGAAAAVEEGSPRPHPAEGQRRKRVMWTEPEVEELVRLVKMYGRGSWRTIQDEGQAVFQGRRQQTDLKDKWRNIQKRMQPHELQEIEAREAELREQLDASNKRKPGRPPGFALLSPKRRRGEEGEEEEEEERDEVEDADEEDAAAAAAQADAEEGGEAAQEERGGREAEEEEGEETEGEGEEPRRSANKGGGGRRSGRGGGRGKKGKEAPRRSGRRH